VGTDRVAVLFTDVSGHGMSAALLTAIIKTAFETWKEDGAPLEAFAATLNRLLCNVTPAESFAAVVLAAYDASSRELSYVNCGHNPAPLWLPATDGAEVRWLDDSTNMVLGVAPDVKFEPARQTLAPGDTVFFATDGVTESMDADDRLFGNQRLRQHLQQRRTDPLSRLVQGLVEQVDRFTGGAPQSDDRTILALRVR
jgi:sigma-B regulation protein RsbU (phosphoserine phosphatase)